MSSWNDYIKEKVIVKKGNKVVIKKVVSEKKATYQSKEE